MKITEVKKNYYCEDRAILGNYPTGLILELQDGRFMAEYSTDTIQSYAEIDKSKLGIESPEPSASAIDPFLGIPEHHIAKEPKSTEPHIIKSFMNLKGKTGKLNVAKDGNTELLMFICNEDDKIYVLAEIHEAPSESKDPLEELESLVSYIINIYKPTTEDSSYSYNQRVGASRLFTQIVKIQNRITSLKGE